jgi:phenylacetate-CoA ligase
VKTGELVPDGHPGEIVFTPLECTRHRRSALPHRRHRRRRPHLGKVPQLRPHLPASVGPISRVSEVKELHMDKLKGTLVNFNCSNTCWTISAASPPGRSSCASATTTRSKPTRCICTSPPSPVCANLNSNSPSPAAFHEATEITPNGLHFHSLAEMREQLGIGRLLKEEKIVDHRPKRCQV